MREALIGLAGVIAGGALTTAGQHFILKAERVRADARALVESCALLIAHEEDYRNRIWEERNNIASGVVAEWDLFEAAKAEASLRILSHGDRGLLRAIDSLSTAGKKLGGIWRTQSGDESEMQEAWERHGEALDLLIAASGR